MRLATPIGGIFYEEGYGINNFEVVDYFELLDVLPETWEQISEAPGNTLANMKMVPAARAIDPWEAITWGLHFPTIFRALAAWGSRKRTMRLRWLILGVMSIRFLI